MQHAQVLQHLKGLTFAKLAKYSVQLFVFCVPLQLQSFLYSQQSYETGLFNPFTTISINLSDLFLFCGIFFAGMAITMGQLTIKEQTKKQKTLTSFILLFVASLQLSLIFSNDLKISVIFMMRIIEFFAFYLMCTMQIIKYDELKRVFLVSVLLQSFLGIAQYLLQENTLFQFIGEPTLSANTPGVAKIPGAETTLIRAYGTFSHPNILAAYLLFGIFIAIFSFKKMPLLYSAILIIFALALLFTFSRSAWLALIFGILFYLATSDKKIPSTYIILASSVVLFLVTAFDLFPFIKENLLRTGINERISLLDNAKTIFYSNTLGTGIGTFVQVMQDYTQQKIAPWDIQPVHNLFFLVLVEAGVIALIALFALFIAIFKLSYSWFRRYKRRNFAGLIITLWGAILVLAMFDHYFFTLYQGIFLFWLFLSFNSYFLDLETQKLDLGSQN